MPSSISNAWQCQGSRQNLQVLENERRRATTVNPQAVRNVQPIDNRTIRCHAGRLNRVQLGTVLLFATALATLPRGAGAMARQRQSDHPRGQAVDESRATRLHAVQYSRGDRTSGFALRSNDIGSGPSPDPVTVIGRGVPTSEVRPDDRLRDGIKQSFVVDGSNLGDRVAEGIVTRLPGWPADRPLWIVRSRAGGGYETIRTYPEVQRAGKPVQLLLDNNVYVALAEEGSPFGEGARMTEPVGETQRGNSFYLALQQGLFPGQRRAMGIPSWDTDDVSLLRDKVAVFSGAKANAVTMDRLFRECERELCWLNAQPRMVAKAPTPTTGPGTSSGQALSCPVAEREKSIGPADARARFVFNIYVHQDVTWDTDRIMDERVDGWLKEMSGLLPAEAALRVRIVRGAAGIADLDYIARPADDRLEGDDQYKGYHVFRNAIGRNMPCPSVPGMPREYHVLLTGQPLYSPPARDTTLGLAGDYVGIACIGKPTTLGHELGHLIGATHGDGKSLFVGQSGYCVTIMHERGGRYRLASTCPRYSDRNRANIKRTLQARMPKASAGQGKGNNPAPRRG